MQLHVTQENLHKALSATARVATTRNTLPILANVLFKTVNNQLMVAATNLDIAITYSLGAKVKIAGATTVPARLMSEFIASVPSGVIDVSLEDNKLHIKTDQYNSTINGTPVDEFPVMPEITDGTTLTLPLATLKRGLQQVVPAASSDDARPVLTAIYMHVVDGQLFIVATDSYRLAEKRLAKQSESVSLLLPVSAMQEVLRLMDDSTEQVTITFDDQQAQFVIGDVNITTRLIDGNYPDYRKLIPSEFSVDAVVVKSDLASITKVSGLFARENAGSVTLKVDSDNQEIMINSIASQVGENTAKASAEVTGSGEITLNSRYISDALSALDGAQVRLRCNDKLDPCVVTSPDDEDYLHIIMPLRS